MNFVKTTQLVKDEFVIWEDRLALNFLTANFAWVCFLWLRYRERVCRVGLLERCDYRPLYSLSFFAGHVDVDVTYRETTRYPTKVGLMLVQRLWRWANIKPTLAGYIVLVRINISAEHPPLTKRQYLLNRQVNRYCRATLQPGDRS